MKFGKYYTVAGNKRDGREMQLYFGLFKQVPLMTAWTAKRFSVRFTSGRDWTGRTRFVLKLDIGPGAGTIGGSTLFIARNTHHLDWLLEFRNGFRLDGKRYSWFTRKTKIQAGFTHNGNLVPYV